MTQRLSKLSMLALLAACTAERPAPSKAKPTTEWTVTPRGVGTLHAGMTRTDAEAALGASLAAPGNETWSNCGYAVTDRLPPGVRVMVEGGSIARIDVDSGQVATAEGARIGDSEARIDELYPGRVTVTPHKYTQGHYLTVKSAAPADSEFRLIFETDGQRVTSYRAGRLRPVEYVERCG